MLEVFHIELISHIPLDKMDLGEKEIAALIAKVIAEGKIHLLFQLLTINLIFFIKAVLK